MGQVKSKQTGIRVRTVVTLALAQFSVQFVEHAFRMASATAAEPAESQAPSSPATQLLLFDLEPLPPISKFPFASVRVADAELLPAGDLRVELLLRSWLDGVALLVNDRVPAPDASPEAMAGRDFKIALDFAPGTGRQFLLRMIDPFGEVQESRYAVVAASARHQRKFPALLAPPSAFSWSLGVATDWVSYEQGSRWDWTQMTSTVRGGLQWDLSSWLERISLWGRGEASLLSWVKSPAGTEAGRQTVEAGLAWNLPWPPLPWSVTLSGGARWCNLAVPSRAYGFRNVLGPAGSLRGDWFSSRRNRFSVEAGMALVGSSLGILPLSNLSWFGELSWRHALRPVLGYRDWDWRIRYQQTRYDFGLSPIRMDEASFGLGFLF